MKLSEVFLSTQIFLLSSPLLSSPLLSHSLHTPADHVLLTQAHQGPSETTAATPLELNQNHQDQNQDQYQDQDLYQDQDQEQELSMVPNWYPVSSRARRVAGMMSDVCCEKGCSMKELIQFC